MFYASPTLHTQVAKLNLGMQMSVTSRCWKLRHFLNTLQSSYHATFSSQRLKFYKCCRGIIKLVYSGGNSDVVNILSQSRQVPPRSELVFSLHELLSLTLHKRKTNRYKVDITDNRSGSGARRGGAHI